MISKRILLLLGSFMLLLQAGVILAAEKKITRPNADTTDSAATFQTDRCGQYPDHTHGDNTVEFAVTPQMPLQPASQYCPRMATQIPVGGAASLLYNQCYNNGQIDSHCSITWSYQVESGSVLTGQEHNLFATQHNAPVTFAHGANTANINAPVTGNLDHELKHYCVAHITRYQTVCHTNSNQCVRVGQAGMHKPQIVGCPADLNNAP